MWSLEQKLEYELEMQNHNNFHVWQIETTRLKIWFSPPGVKTQNTNVQGQSRQQHNSGSLNLCLLATICCWAAGSKIIGWFHRLAQQPAIARHATKTSLWWHFVLSCSVQQPQQSAPTSAPAWQHLWQTIGSPTSTAFAAVTEYHEARSLHFSSGTFSQSRS